MEDKNRYWTFILYPESAPSNWREILQDTGLQIAVSPLHNKDINPTGEVKKPHFHILLCFNGPTTFRKVNSICSLVNAPIPKRVLSIIGVYRYFTHKDNPEKAQYCESDITTINGFDIQEFSGMTTSQILAIKKSIIDIIRTHDIREYSQLTDYLLDNDLLDYFQVCSSNTLFIDRYISSRRNSLTFDL